MTYDYDLIVIGGGSGGVRGARMAASKGAKVALVEGSRMGGTCVIRGCVPKKLLSFASHGFEELHHLEGYGYEIGTPSFSWEKLIHAKDTEIDRLEGVYNRILKTSDVTILNGWATFIDNHTVKVDEREYTAERFLIATGGHVSIPDIPGKEHFITSNEAFDLKDLPSQIAVYGGGYIAVEFAGIFSGLGADTTLAYRGDRPLRGFDEETRDHFFSELEKKPLNLQMNKSIVSIEATTSSKKKLNFDDGSAIEVDLILAATGRVPNTAGLNLETAGVKVGVKKEIQVDAYSQTSQSNIYAVGDVTDRMALTPVAINEAMAFVETVYGDESKAQSYEFVATAVFSNPEVCTVGLTEEEARKIYRCGRVYNSTFRAMRHVLPGADDKTFMKLVVDDETDKVVGLHIVGLNAAEMAQGFAVAMKAGATKRQFDSTVGIHPTSAEEIVTMRAHNRTWRRD